jgi:hypothetical protein
LAPQSKILAATVLAGATGALVGAALALVAGAVVAGAGVAGVALALVVAGAAGLSSQAESRLAAATAAATWIHVLIIESRSPWGSPKAYAGVSAAARAV